jgi:hypothetical protein
MRRDPVSPTKRNHGGRVCLDPAGDLSPGQMEEIERVIAAYPHLTDDQFVSENLDTWLS